MPTLNRPSHPKLLMDLPAKVKYALLALLELVSPPNPQTPMTINDIASRQPIPERYLEQVLVSLRLSGLVQSHRGAKGGYLLAKEPWQITLLDVVIALEGESKLDQPFPISTPDQTVIYNIWHKARLALQDHLQQTTLDDLRRQRDESQQPTPMFYI